MSADRYKGTIAIEVNGTAIEANITHRTSLADFLRENLILTGTHLGCEQGVCGACTVEIDGEAARSCLTLASACNNKKITTIEGYDDDLVMASLRAAFSKFHGLQCGFCTPGFLITCRDIVQRNIVNDDAEIRMALSGNLCRCTGYVGIVKAVKEVLSLREGMMSQVAAKAGFDGELRTFKRTTGVLKERELVSDEAGVNANDQMLQERFYFNHSADVVWALIGDVELMVPCVPGARLIERHGEKLKIEMQSSFGSITAKFMGDGTITTNDAERTGKFGGSGKDIRSGSGASGQLDFAIVEEGAGCWLELTVGYNITGPLAQFSRGGLVKSFARATIKIFVDNMIRVLNGEDITSGQQSGLSVTTLIWTVVKQWFSSIFSKK